VWLNLGDPNLRKSLNELEIETSDPLLTTTVEGASTDKEFLTPTSTLVSNAPLTLNAFNEYKVFLAGTIAKDRHYRFTFVSTSTISSTNTDVILGFLTAEVIPIHKV